jgi:hypothetical protein
MSAQLPRYSSTCHNGITNESEAPNSSFQYASLPLPNMCTPWLSGIGGPDAEFKDAYQQTVVVGFAGYLLDATKGSTISPSLIAQVTYEYNLRI